MLKTLIAAVALHGTIAGTTAFAQLAQLPGPIEALRPGESLWAPDIAPAGPVTILISLPLQRAYVYRNGVPIAVSTVSTGKKGHETPTGVFTILQKHADHKSNRYNDAPMPFMQRLTWDGVALHAGSLPGHPASHGCIRLPLDFAQRLFAITRTGITVVVTNASAAPEVFPATVTLVPPASVHAEPGDYVWMPERSPTGPLSIVVSGRDRRVVVLRNGREIGSAPVQLDAPIAVTAAYTLRSIDADGTHWFKLPLPDGSRRETGELSAADRALGHVPEGFRRSLAAALVPGTTLLVTRDTLLSSGTGTRIGLLQGGDAGAPR